MLSTAEFIKKKNELLSKIDKEQDMQNREKLQGELSRLISDFEADTAAMQRENVNKGGSRRELNNQFREFLREKKFGSKFELTREAIAGTKTTDVAYSQRKRIAGVLDNSFSDRVIYDKAGCPISNNATSLSDWIYLNNPTCSIEGELVGLGDAQKLEEAKKSEITRRLAVKIVISNQALEDNGLDLIAIATQKINAAFAELINFAATSTSKANTYFYGGFAHESKQTGTYTAGGFTYAKAMEMVGKVAKKNYFPEYGVFVMGPEDYYALKATPRDAGSGLMVIDEDGRLGGFPVFSTNAINRETPSGAAEGHNIGFGCFNFLPCIQHGNVRLTIDRDSAAAGDVDGVIIIVNADWSMTDLYPDAFVVYSQSEQQSNDTPAAGGNDTPAAGGGDTPAAGGNG